MTTSATATPADATCATEVARLRATFRSGRTRPDEWRLAQLRGLERLLVDNEAELAAALLADLGRPANDSFLGDIAPTLAEVRFALKHLARWRRPQRVGLPLSQRPGRAWFDFEPLGVVLVIGPWNYPVYLTLGPLVGAIAAGNCAVLKPSEHAPAVAAALVRLVPQYLDADAFTVLDGGPEVTQGVLAQGVDHAFFTGGPEIGKAVMAAAAPHLTPVTLELGGKCPAVVSADAVVDVAARRIAWTKLLNSGQTCIAPDYVLVERSVRDDFVAALLRAFRAMAPDGSGGRALPIVTERHATRLAGLLEDHGGEVVLGGGSAPEERRHDLTVVLDPDAGSVLMQEEIFGPILPVVTVDSVADAIGRVNAGPKPLAAYLFSESADEERTFRADVPAGAVVTNHAAMHVLCPELPFGGVGNSGMGAYHGRWGFEAFSHRKSHLARSARIDPRVVYPPYGPLTRRLLRLIF